MKAFPARGRPRAGARMGPGDRLRRGWEFKRVYDHGRASHGRLLVVFLLRQDDIPRRAGFVAGRKVGGSVQRNRGRRLLREAYRALKSRLPGTGVQMVLVAKKACVEQTLEAVSREMSELFSRLGLLSQPPGDQSPRGS